MSESEQQSVLGPDVSGLAEQRFRVVLARGTWAAMLSHVLFMALFASLAVWALVLFNAGSVLLYAACVWLIRRHRFSQVLVAAMIEVVAHAVLALVYVGWASGFHYYVLVLTPLVFFHPRWLLARKLGIVTLLAAAYLWLSFGLPATPLHAVPGETLGLIRAVNIVASFAFLAYFVHHYAAAASSAEARLAHLAGTDPLTGLFNRRRLAEHAGLEIARHRRANRPLALIVCDIDDFKQINDRHGHDCGDLVLKAVAARVRETLRGQDIVARWGGEELLLVLPETGRDDAAAVAGKLRRLIEQLRVSCNGREIGITITAGVYELRPGDTLDAGVARADHAMLQGKRAGKNRVVVAPAA